MASTRHLLCASLRMQRRRLVRAPTTSYAHQQLHPHKRSEGRDYSCGSAGLQGKAWAHTRPGRRARVIGSIRRMCRRVEGREPLCQQQHLLLLTLYSGVRKPAVDLHEHFNNHRPHTQGLLGGLGQELVGGWQQIGQESFQPVARPPHAPHRLRREPDPCR